MEEYVSGDRLGSGLDVANAVAQRGQSVAVVETGRLGGTCLNRRLYSPEDAALPRRSSRDDRAS